MCPPSGTSTALLKSSGVVSSPLCLIISSTLSVPSGVGLIGVSGDQSLTTTGMSTSLKSVPFGSDKFLPTLTVVEVSPALEVSAVVMTFISYHSSTCNTSLIFSSPITSSL